MSKYLLAAAAAALLLVGANVGQAAHEVPEGWVELTQDECGFNNNQWNNGFRCYEATETEEISRIIGNGNNCQDATITTTNTYFLNQNHALMESRTVEGEPEQSDWGSAYPFGGGCNF